MPDFVPNPGNEVAGESLHDSNINNCNKSILRDDKSFWNQGNLVLCKVNWSGYIRKRGRSYEAS